MMRGIIGIVRSREPVDLYAICHALAQGGVDQVEITLNTPGALAAIAELRKDFAGRVGAGTILKPLDAVAAIDAGAQFIVTPTLQPETVSICRDHEVPIFCGAMTPTEILAAHHAGAHFVKLFPAASLGLEYIKAVLGPLPFVPLVPTGGVSLENIRDFLQVCPAVGIGGNLVDAALVRERRWGELTELARQFILAAGAEA